MSASSGSTPAALTITTSVANLNSSWLILALNAERLDEELAQKGAEPLFIRLCDQIRYSKICFSAVIL